MRRTVPLARLAPVLALLLPATLVALVKPHGRLTPAADMAQPRMAHTATALADGRVLVAGGFTTPARAARSAERFDPTTGRFAPAGAMRAPRHSHSATRLADGRVLLTGGYVDGNAITASTELYDPATNRFAVGAPLTEPRAGHVAVPLADGRVLVVGGVGPGWRHLATAELYDPRTGRFTPTGAMATARESHVAVPLADGRVLVVGGHRGRRADMVLHASAELYDPATGRFAPTGAMATRRHKHDAVRLADGRVLVTGGSDERDDRGAYASTELYDPVTGRWSPGPPMQRARYKHQGTSVLLPGGNVLVAGGASEAEVYDARVGAFALAGEPGRLAGLFGAVAPLPGGRVLVTGGYGADTEPRATSWLFQP